MYHLARIGIVPLSLMLTASLNRTSHSVATLSSSLTATLNLLIATTRSGVRVTWESIVAGVFSSIFVALYPIFIIRTHRKLVSSLTRSGVPLTESPPSGSTAVADAAPPSVREDARATWQMMHYTSLLSILMLLPIVLLSGELGLISRNCYILDLPFSWFIGSASSLAGWSVFVLTIIMTRTTSPLSTTFLIVPRSAVQLVIFSRLKLPVYSWVGVALCLLASGWYAVVRRRKSRSSAGGGGGGSSSGAGHRGRWTRI